MPEPTSTLSVSLIQPNATFPFPSADEVFLVGVPLPKRPNSRFRSLLGTPPFGRLTVESYAGRFAGKAYWNCRCSCGRRVAVATCDFSSGRISCGCSRGEPTKRFRGSPEYQTWKNSRNRCRNPKTTGFNYYGGRGIKFCSGWNSFLAFRSDMGPRPSAQHSIDRKDTDGHYSCGHCPECIANGWPANCQWATRKEQARNKRSNRRITFNGQEKTLAEWSESTGLKFATIRRRLKQGESVESALTQPLHEGISLLGRGRWDRRRKQQESSPD